MPGKQTPAKPTTDGHRCTLHSLDAVLGKDARVLLDQRILGLAQHVGQLLLGERLQGEQTTMKALVIHANVKR